MDEVFFDHERLQVYQKAIEFNKWTMNILSNIQKQEAIYNQMERASHSIALNIAEGNGRYYPKDKSRFFDIAMGSALECAACIDVLLLKGSLSNTSMGEGKLLLKSIASMLTGLIKSHVQRKNYNK